MDYVTSVDPGSVGAGRTECNLCDVASFDSWKGGIECFIDAVRYNLRYAGFRPVIICGGAVEGESRFGGDIPVVGVQGVGMYGVQNMAVSDPLGPNGSYLSRHG